MDQESPKSYFSTKLIFILFGVASLLGWNALLTELKFFNNFLSDMKPYVSFSFLNYILNILFLFLMMWKKNLFSLKFQLIGGIIGSIIFLILIPTCTILLDKNSLINQIITGSLIVLMGFINALCSGGFFNFVSYFPLEMIVALSTGQGFSGIAMNILQYIVLVSVTVDDDDKKYTIQAWIFFAISSLILLLCLIILLISFNSKYFQYYLNKANNQVKDDVTSGLIIGEEGNDEFSDKTPTPNPGGEQKEVSFKELFKKLWDLNLIMTYIYIVTFALFPNASINQKMFGLEGDYSTNTVILVYNVFDTIGRYLVAKVKPTKKLNLIVNLGRSILLFTLVFNYYCQQTINGPGWNINVTSILLIINVGLLAVTNGIGTTLCFGLAPNQVEDEYKGQAGTSLSFFLIVGIFLGSCCAFGTDAIIAGFLDP